MLDADFKRIQYNRYADDFVVGVIGSKQDAIYIKEDLRRFLSEKLKLTLSEEKTKVTHSWAMTFGSSEIKQPNGIRTAH